ncbi:MAG: hypothetical protein Q9219_004220 [cf. Caloplaca sp. 3 TL-2023]
MVIITPPPVQGLNAYSISPLTAEMNTTVRHGLYDGTYACYGDPIVSLTIHDRPEFYGISHYDLRITLDSEGSLDPDYYPYDPHDPREKINTMGLNWTDPETKTIWGQVNVKANLSKLEWSVDPNLNHDHSPTGGSSSMVSSGYSVGKHMAQIPEQCSDTVALTAQTGRTARKIGELSPVAKALKDWEVANKSITELQQLLRDPATDTELRSLATDEIAQTSTSLTPLLTTLQTALIPPDPFASLPCLLEIRPGAGGSEAGIFVGDLLRMYQAYCKNRSLHATLVKLDAASASKSSKSALAEIQEAILEIATPGAYGVLKCEAGVHRVQRVPATETQGRTHTSAASVLVLPSFPDELGEHENEELSLDDPNSDYYINPADVRTDVMRARGAGGQHVNTTDSAIRLTHIPTSTVVSMQDARSQHKNRAKAWQVLRSKIAQQRREARDEEKAQLRISVVGVARMGRGDKVRTYNWGQQRVTDHRSGVTLNRLEDVLEGGAGLEEVMESVRVWQRERDVEALIADEEAEARVVEKKKEKDKAGAK